MRLLISGSWFRAPRRATVFFFFWLFVAKSGLQLDKFLYNGETTRMIKQSQGNNSKQGILKGGGEGDREGKGRAGEGK